MYLAIAHGAPAPLEFIIWSMAERFSWPLEYVEALPMSRLHEWEQILDGKQKAGA